MLRFAEATYSNRVRQRELISPSSLLSQCLQKQQLTATVVFEPPYFCCNGSEERHVELGVISIIELALHSIYYFGDEERLPRVKAQEQLLGGRVKCSF